MSIATIRFEIARYYRAELDHVEVLEYGGTFTAEDVKRISVKSPAVAVACLGLPEIQFQGHDVEARVSFGAFCFAKNRKKVLRDVEALNLMESVAAGLLQNRWKDKDGEPTASGAPQEITGANLYSTVLDKMLVALWAVRWVQKIDLDRGSFATLPDFETLYATVDLDEEEDAEDLTDIVELDT